MLDIRDGITGTWGYSKWVGMGVDFARGVPINDWNCCAGALPITQQPPKLGTWSAPGSVHAGGATILMGMEPLASLRIRWTSLFVSASPGCPTVCRPESSDLPCDMLPSRFGDVLVGARLCRDF